MRHVVALLVLAPGLVWADPADSSDEDELVELLDEASVDARSDREIAEDVALRGLLQRGFAMTRNRPAAVAKLSGQRAFDVLLSDVYVYEFLRNGPHLPRKVTQVAFDIPLAEHHLVDAYIEYFTTRGRTHFEKWLERLARYQPLMEPILIEEGLPRDTIYLAMIESGLSARAVSWAAAAGFWQFIRSTGRTYGLRADFWADERRDFVLATRGACRYLKDLYREFGDWHLAWSAYNAGAGRVRRALKRYNETNYWSLIAHPGSLAKETQHYVPKVIAAAIVAKNAKDFGFTDLNPLPTFAYDEITVTGATDFRRISRKFLIPEVTLRELNPAFKHGITPPRTRAILRVPKGRGEEVRAWLDSIPASERLVYRKHTIESGDTLYDIARAYGTTVSFIQQFNSARARALRPGRTLIVPTLRSKTVARRSSSKPTSMSRYVKGKSHRVRSGDTLWSIANRYGTTVAALKKRNGKRSNSLKAGEVLRVR